MAVSDRILGLSVPVTETLDPKLWKERYAYGVLLGAVQREWVTINRGGDTRRELVKKVDAIPDTVIRWHLRAALSELEVKLGIPMGIVICKATPVDDGLKLGQDYDKVVPRLPYTLGTTQSWWQINVPSGCISIERVRAYYFGTKIWEFSTDRGNDDQIRLVHPGQGTAHLLPTNLASLIITPEGRTGVFFTVYSNATAVPDFWAVDYTLGPVTKSTGQVGHIEAVLADWVYCAAGIKLLNLASMAVSKGVTSSTVSMDGVSRSVSLQASAMYGMNSALEKVYSDAMQRIDWKALRTYKKGLRLRQYG